MPPPRCFSHGEAARFYDRLGAGLDTQAFYETAALHQLVEHMALEHCRSLVEFGCGTGRLAAELLATRLPPDASYLGLDASARMVELTARRLRRFGDRATARQTDGVPRIDAPDRAFDRFVCCYVLDLLAEEDIRALLDEAHRVLRPDGLLGLASLTSGPTAGSRALTAAWRGLHRLSPWLVGGCRPIALRGSLMPDRWSIVHAAVVVRFAVPSEIVVATPAVSAVPASGRGNP